jgi:hypothetical protein
MGKQKYTVSRQALNTIEVASREAMNDNGDPDACGSNIVNETLQQYSGEKSWLILDQQGAGIPVQ